MNIPVHPQPAGGNSGLWGSDSIASLLRALDISFVSLTPGASFRGLHDSLVNHLGNSQPEMLLAIHEESAVALAHGYARVTGKPLAVALHSNVGLMHATMAIFNAWCDRIPMLLIGAVGPMDAMRRRPWVDWIHTATDLAALLRGYIKWDNQPASVPAALESIIRAHRITLTPPAGPVYVCLDAALQEEPLDPLIEPPSIERFPLPCPAEPTREAVGRTASTLSVARRPLIMIGRVSNKRADWDRRVALAERLGARVLTDIKTGASFPTAHPLQPCPPALYVSNEAGRLIREADAILSLDWIDLGGTLRQACGGAYPRGRVIQCSMDQYVHNGWSMDYQALPPTDLTILAAPDRLVERLLDVLPEDGVPADPPERSAPEEPGPEEVDGLLAVEAMARITVESLAAHRPSYLRLPLGWPGTCCRFDDPLDYIGFDGGGGIGSGPGMAVGSALALRGSDRLPVAVLGDGDFLMGVTALWTAVRYKIPLLVLVANNQSFFNDELHQERVARERGRPTENRSIGVRMSDPAMDLALMARGQGAIGIGPISSAVDLRHAIAKGVAEVKRGHVCVVDIRVAPEYSRGLSSTLLRQLPSAAAPDLA